MARAKRIYILIINVKKLFSFSSSRSERSESLGELEKAVETLACGSCSHSISRSPKLPLVFLYLDKNKVTNSSKYRYTWSYIYRNRSESSLSPVSGSTAGVVTCTPNKCREQQQGHVMDLTTLARCLAGFASRSEK